MHPSTLRPHLRSIAPGPLLMALFALHAPAAESPGYPAWRGPDGSGAAVDSGAELVERFADGRFAWASEADNPLPHDYKGLSRPLRMIGNGGFGPPVVADGRVYVATFTPTGPLASIFWENVDADSPDAVKHIDADDTLTCLDADTGLTLWQTRIPESGINFAAKMYAGQYAPCVAEGVVAWVGCLGQMHCVDAVSGEHRWSQSTGGIAELDARYRRYLLDVGKIGGRGPNDPAFEKWQATPDKPLTPEERAGSRGFGWDSATVIAEGVAVANTRNGDAVAHDLETGAQLWRRAGALGATRGPLVWRHDDTAAIITVNGNTIACLDPRSGAERWTAACGSKSYNGHTPAISGDRLIATGPGKGFACWRLGAEGATKLWELPSLFASGYESPLIYRGHVWISKIHAERVGKQWDELAARWPQAFTAAAKAAFHNDEGRVVFRNAMACVELESGEVRSLIGTPMLDHSSLVAMDGRLVLNSNGLTLVDADPVQPRLLDAIDVQNIWCTTPAVCDGKLYFRGTRHLINCWDLRADAPEPDPAPAPDWRNARLSLDLAGIRQPSDGRKVIRYRGGKAPMPPGSDLRLHLRTREGVIRQAWMTYGPEHADPEQVWTDELTLADGQLRGRVRCRAIGLHYSPQLEVDLRQPVITGSFADPATGEPMAGTITGQAERVVLENGTVKLRLRREWNGGMNPGHQTFLDFTLKDGVGIDPKIYTRADNTKTWTATFERFDVTYRDGVLTGDLRLDCKSHGHAKSGAYRVTFAAPASCNRFADSYRVWRDGEEVTPRNPTNRSVWGTMEPAADEALRSDNALYTVELENAMEARQFLRVFLEYRNGKLVSTKAAAPKFCAGEHPIDASGLTRDGRRIHGDITVRVQTDGHVPLCDQPCRYEVDFTLAEDGSLSGSYEGTYAVRTPTEGRVTGRMLAEP